jgi:hypothetical protein
MNLLRDSNKLFLDLGVTLVFCVRMNHAPHLGKRYFSFWILSLNYKVQNILLSKWKQSIDLTMYLYVYWPMGETLSNNYKHNVLVWALVCRLKDNCSCFKKELRKTQLWFIKALYGVWRLKSLLMTKEIVWNMRKQPKIVTVQKERSGLTCGVWTLSHCHSHESNDST